MTVFIRKCMFNLHFNILLNEIMYVYIYICVFRERVIFLMEYCIS